MRSILHILAFVALLTVQVSFISALPFPFDHIPILLVVTIYLYQYRGETSLWWWFICYGLVLDVLATSYAPLEGLSYAWVSLGMVLLSKHVFTNKSFYGMTAMALSCLLILSISQILLLFLTHLSSSSLFLWKTVVVTNSWFAVFASALLLFILPWVRKARERILQITLRRL